MRVTRVLDILVLLLLGTLVVMPRPSVTVKPALALGPERRERVAELQAHLLGTPGDLTARLELADLFLDAHRPDWALATVNRALPQYDADYRVHSTRAVAYADRFEAAPAFQAATRALELCEASPPPAQPGGREAGASSPAPGAEPQAPGAPPPCGEAPLARLHLLHDTLERVKGIDMRENPALAKDRIFEGLHPTWIKKPRPPTPGPTLAPPTPAARP
jgi:hypothetical protein